MTNQTRKVHMDNKVLDDIKQYAEMQLQQAYGYCGVAESPEMAMLNSGGEGENITITIRMTALID